MITDRDIEEMKNKLYYLRKRRSMRIIGMGDESSPYTDAFEDGESFALEWVLERMCAK